MTHPDAPFIPTLYIAGPMSGIEDHNYPAFRHAAQALRDEGYKVLNPVDIDHGDHEPGSKPWEWYMRRTLKMLLDADAIATLPGWRNSRGATLEVDLAAKLDIPEAPLIHWLTYAAEEQAEERAS